MICTVKDLLDSCVAVMTAEPKPSSETKDKAIRLMLTALEMDSTNPDVLHNIGAIYNQKKDPIKAKDYLCRAISHSPQKFESWKELSTAYRELDQFIDANICIQRAIDINPNHAELWYQSAALCEILNDYDRAENAYKRCIGADPNHSMARFQWGMIKMLMGDFSYGLPLYESRHLFYRPPIRLDNPIDLATTDSESVKRIIVWAEQGIGDTFQMSRYGSMLKRHFPKAEICLWVRESLVDILRLFAGWDYVVPLTSAIDTPDKTLTIGAMSLPYVAHLLGEDLYQPPAMIKNLKLKLTSNVAICWRGAPEHGLDRFRSIPDDAIRTFLEETKNNCKFIRMQTPPVRDDINAFFTLYDTGPWVKTLDMLSQCALLITCDTAVAHLAGTMGVPVWLLLANNNDWRWGRDKETTPWYNNMQIFHQKEPLKWEPVLAEVSARLKSVYPVAKAAEP